MSSEILDSQELRDGSAAVKWSGSRLTFSSTWNFLVVTDSTTVTREEVLLSTPGLPVVGVVYGPLNMRCMSKSAKRVKDNPLYWEVTSEFESGAEEQKPNSSDPNNPDPTTWIPVFQISAFATRQKVITVDKSSTPKKIVNSAKTPFDPPVTETRLCCVIQFTQYEDPGQDIDVFLARNDTVNKTAFAGKAARTLKLNVTGAELGHYAGFAAWKINYQMTYDRDNWDTELLDVGPMKLNISGDQIPCTDKKGTTKIVGNLNGAGVQVWDADPATLTFKTFDELEFSGFIRTA